MTLEARLEKLADRVEAHYEKIEERASKQMHRLFEKELVRWQKRYAPTWHVGFTEGMGCYGIEVRKGAVKYRLFGVPHLSGQLDWERTAPDRGPDAWHWGAPRNAEPITALHKLFWAFMRHSELVRHWDAFELAPCAGAGR